VNINVI